MIRIAAVGDVHLGEDNRGRLRPHFSDIGQRADALLLAGDLTQHGSAAEGRIVAEEFRDLGVPVVAVLGNHDYHSNAQTDITAILVDAGIDVLEGTATVLECNGNRVGVAGTKGFGGGFPGRCATAFGEPQVKAFIAYTEELAEGLRASLTGLDADFRIALTHYAPVKDTLAGEPTEIYPFLGSICSPRQPTRPTRIWPCMATPMPARRRG